MIYFNCIILSSYQIFVICFIFSGSICCHALIVLLFLVIAIFITILIGEQ